jgi:hypothetical protein
MRQPPRVVPPSGRQRLQPLQQLDCPEVVDGDRGGNRPLHTGNGCDPVDDTAGDLLDLSDECPARGRLRQVTDDLGVADVDADDALVPAHETLRQGEPDPRSGSGDNIGAWHDDHTVLQWGGD